MIKNLNFICSQIWTWNDGIDMECGVHKSNTAPTINRLILTKI